MDLSLERILFHVLFIACFALANFVFLRAVLYRLELVFSGAEAQFQENFSLFPDLTFRIKSVLKNVVFQKKLFQDPLRGIMHAFIFYGFIVYSIHNTTQMIAGAFGWWVVDPYAFSLPGLISPVLQHFYESMLGVVSLLVLTGLGFFAWRRWVQKAPGLDYSSPASAIVILMISNLMISSLLGEGAKTISATYSSHAFTPFVLYQIIGSGLLHLGLTPETADGFFHLMWWVHILTVFTFMLYVPTSKHGHLIFAPINFFFATNTPKGALYKMDLENEMATFGGNQIQNFPWPNLLDGLSCIECGRCTIECPANRTGKALNPKEIIVNLKHALMEKMPEYNLATMGLGETEKFEKSMELETQVVGNYTSEEAIWGCTTCYACVEACPVGNNQVTAIVEMRRNLVLAESRFPKELQKAFVNMEKNSNPWGVGAQNRAEWAEGLNVKTLAEDANVDVLFWVGCSGSFDTRNKQISRSFAKILQKADVKFGILGSEENCSGDSARRGGNEYLYQTLAQTNVDTINGYGVKKVVTACPHCFNTIKNEYPQFGGNYQVMHHSEFIQQLVAEGKVPMRASEELSKGKLTYHDSCYLGRYNDNYSAPREVVKAAVAGTEVLEASDHHSKSLCCGAGGAQMWMEEQNNDRVNIKRTKQLMDTGAKTIATACPFCMTMISDGVKNCGHEEDVKVKDISEIVAESMV